jgi:glycosyltransferase involved in cell wall biosynthesis
VHWNAFRRYRGRLAGNFDLVIDEVNTIPFFTPLWSRIPRLMLMMQLAREVWWYEGIFPLNAIGYILEPLYLRLYRRVPVLTICDSTSKDLRMLGFRSSITVLPVGVETVNPGNVPKADEPTFIYCGRLTASKRVDDILRAFAIFEAEQGPGQLWLVGDGPDRYVSALRRLASRLGITGRVRFWGRLPADEKHRKMAEAHALLMASVREGWGLVINEANACGTPAIVYDVPGLRDAVKHGSNGLVVRPQPRHLATAMIQLSRDRSQLRNLERRVQGAGSTFSFDQTAAVAEAALLAGSTT